MVDGPSSQWKTLDVVFFVVCWLVFLQFFHGDLFQSFWEEHVALKNWL